MVGRTSEGPESTGDIPAYLSQCLLAVTGYISDLTLRKASIIKMDLMSVILGEVFLLDCWA